MNILYKATLEKMGLALQDLKACATTLYGFSGEGIACMGSIELSVTLGDYPVSATKMMEFVVVDLPSAYNVLLGRPALVRLGAVSSLRHLAIKFPTSSSIRTLKGDQLARRECYSISIRGKKQVRAQVLDIIQNKDEAVLKIDEEIDPRVEERADLEPLEELEEIRLKELDPLKTVKVGKNLPEETK